MVMDDVWIKLKDKDRDTYVIHWWELQTSVWRCFVPSVSLLSYCLHPILLTPFHGKLYVWWITVVNGYSSVLSVKMVQMLCHNTANHLSVLGQAGIESSDSFASVTNAPQSRVWSSSQSFNHRILLGIPQTRFRPSGFSWMPPSVLAYTTKTLISRNGWLGCQASARLSGDQPCIVYQESKRYSPNRR